MSRDSKWMILLLVTTVLCIALVLTSVVNEPKRETSLDAWWKSLTTIEQHDAWMMYTKSQGGYRIEE
jgi:hypothetical protein